MTRSRRRLWFEKARAQRATRGCLFRAGLLLFVVGSGPLLITMAASDLGLTRDPNPNPVGFGILAMLTFWPSLVMMAVGCWKNLRHGGRDDA